MKRLAQLAVGLALVGTLALLFPRAATAQAIVNVRASGLNNAGVLTAQRISDAGVSYVMPSAVAPLAAVELCATNAAGGTSATLNAATTRFTIENDGPNAVTCTFDGTTPVFSTGGLTLLAKSATFTDRWPIPLAGPTVVKCIATTAAQVSGGCVNLIALQ